MSSRAAVWFGVAGCLALIAGVWYMSRVSAVKIVPITFARDAGELAGILGSSEVRGGARRNMEGDNEFPMAYLAFVIGAIAFVLFAGSGRPTTLGVAFGAASAAAILVGVVFDYRENAGVLAAVADAEAGGANLGALLDPMRRDAMSKWGWIGAAMLAMAAAQWTLASPGLGPATIRAAAAGIGGAAGIAIGLFALSPAAMTSVQMGSLGIVALTILWEAVRRA